VFKTIELGAWYRIRWEGKSVFGQVLQRHRNSYTFRYADAKGKVRTGKVNAKGGNANAVSVHNGENILSDGNVC